MKKQVESDIERKQREQDANDFAEAMFHRRDATA